VRAVREQAARRDLELQPAVLAEQDIRASESRCDALADQHQQTCQPWQTELAELEQTAISRIGQREPPDTEQDARRAELTRWINQATSDLETAIATEHELQAIARRKARLIRQGKPPGYTILAQLSKPPLASPQLLAEQHVAKERTKWLRARQQAAEKALKIQKYNVEAIQENRIYGDLQAKQRRLEHWQAELEAVGEELAEAMVQAEQAHQALLDE